MTVKFLIITLILHFSVLGQGLLNEISKITKNSESTNIMFKFSTLDNEGSIAYLRYKSDGINYIGKYDLNGAQMPIIEKFDNNGKTINPDKLCVTDKYLISYSQHFLSVDYFNLTSLKWIGRFQLEDFPNNMIYLPIKKMIIFTSTAGEIISFSSDISQTITFTEIANGLSAPLQIKVSLFQNYITVADNSNKLRIYSLLTNKKVYKRIMWNDVSIKSSSKQRSRLSISEDRNESNKDDMIVSNNDGRLLLLGGLITTTTTNVTVDLGLANLTIGGTNTTNTNNTTNTTNTTTTTTTTTSPSNTTTLSNTTTIDTTNTTNTTTDNSTTIAPIDNSTSSTITTNNDTSTVNSTTTINNSTSATITIDTTNATATNRTNANTTLSNATTTTNTNTTATNTTVNNSTNTTTTINNNSNTTTTTNTTTTSNSTTTTTSNSTTTISNNTNTTNIINNNTTNITINNTTNNINTTPSNNNNNSNKTQKLTNTVSQQDYQHYQQFLNSILQNQALISLNTLPGARKILKPLFAFFVNFDDLWLYIYHPRSYNKVIDSVFALTQTLQTQKWNLVPLRTLWNKIGIDTEAIYNLFNYRSNYTSSKFLNVENNSNGLFINTANLFFSNIFFTLGVYFTLKIFYHIFRSFKFSTFFKAFTFWPVFVLMFLQGNVQIITYLFAFETQNLFAFNYIHKFGLGATLIVYFLVFIFCTAAILLFKTYYGKCSTYLIQNLKLDMIGITYFCVFFGYKNILMGFFHGFFDQRYLIKLSLLLFVQISLFIYSIILLRRKHCFTIKIKVWINQFTSFARILIIMTFLIDENSISISSQSLEYPHLIIVYVYMCLFVLGILVEICIVCAEIKSLYCQVKGDFRKRHSHPKDLIKNFAKDFYVNQQKVNCKVIDPQIQVTNFNQANILNNAIRKDFDQARDDVFNLVNFKKMLTIAKRTRIPKSHRSLRYKNLILNRVQFESSTRKEIQ